MEIDETRLDAHFVATFLRTDVAALPVANTLGAVSRDDLRRCRIPRMPLAEQRRYGDAFRGLLELDAALRTLADISGKVIEQTIHGLTTGALAPDCDSKLKGRRVSSDFGTNASEDGGRHLGRGRPAARGLQTARIRTGDPAVHGAPAAGCGDGADARGGAGPRRRAQHPEQGKAAGEDRGAAVLQHLQAGLHDHRLRRGQRGEEPARLRQRLFRERPRDPRPVRLRQPGHPAGRGEAALPGRRAIRRDAGPGQAVEPRDGLRLRAPDPEVRRGLQRDRR